MPVGRNLDQPQAGRVGHHAERPLSRSLRGQSVIKRFPGASEDLIKNIHGVAPIAELDGDEVGFLVAKVAEIKRQR
jgi:hypothetical protein